MVTEGRIHFVAGYATRKARNLAVNPQYALPVESDAFDLMVEVRAARVEDKPTLRCVADAYAQKYGWPVTVRDGAFHDTEGAPTAGPPPYLVHALLPTAAFALGPKDDGMNRATRWQFMNAR